MAITTAPESWSATWENNIELARLADAGRSRVPAADRALARLRRRVRLPGQLARDDHVGCRPARPHDLAAPCSGRSTRRCSTRSWRPSRWPRSTCSPVAASGSTSSAAGIRTSSTCSARSSSSTTSATRTAQEWLDVVRTLWREQQPSRLPRPLLRVDQPDRPSRSRSAGSEPVLMNAGYSPAGRAFAMRNCEFLLTSLIDLDSGRARRRRGASRGRAARARPRHRPDRHRAMSSAGRPPPRRRSSTATTRSSTATGRRPIT